MDVRSQTILSSRVCTIFKHSVFPEARRAGAAIAAPRRPSEGLAPPFQPPEALPSTAALNPPGMWRLKARRTLTNKSGSWSVVSEGSPSSITSSRNCTNWELRCSAQGERGSSQHRENKPSNQRPHKPLLWAFMLKNHSQSVGVSLQRVNNPARGLNRPLSIFV